MRKRTYSEEQLNIIKEYYPQGDWEKILPFFQGKTKADIRAIARKNGIKRLKDLKKDCDITGKKYGMLTAVSRLDEERWLCKCDCGNETEVSIYSLLNNNIKSCGCLRHRSAVNAKDFTGMRFGMLEVVEKLSRYNGTKETFYRCRCDCGKEKIIRSGNLSSGHTRSCGGRNHRRKEFEVLNYELDDSEQTYYVYRHISPSGKSYIGITKQNPERRFQNGAGYKTQKVFYRAIEKYGWDSFEHEIVESGLTEKEAYEKEAYYIDEVYKSYAPNGYNIREGGIHAQHYIMPVIQYYNSQPVNYFEGVNQAVKKLDICAATIKKHLGKENAIQGYYFEILPWIMPHNVDVELIELEDEHHYCIKDIVEKEWKSKTVKRNKSLIKPVNRYTLQGKYIETFLSIKEAIRTIPGAKEEGVYAAVNPNRQGETAYGFMWKYDDGNHENINPVKYKNRRMISKIDKKTGKVIREYKSMSEAAKDLNVSMNKIRIACGGRDSFGDFVLRYKM